MNCNYTINVISILVLIWIYNKYMAIRKNRDRDDRTLIYFYRPTCPFCQMFNPVWDEATAQLKDIKIRKVNCDDPEQSFICEAESANGMRGVPHIILIKNGERHIFRGDRTVERLIGFALQ